MDGTLRLIDRIYDTVLNIEGYDQLWDLWQQHLMPGDRPDGALEDEETITEHFRRAHVLLGRLAEGRARHRPGLSDAILHSPRCEFLVSGDGRVLAASARAFQRLGLAPGAQFADLPLEAGMARKVIGLLSELQGQRDEALLAVFAAYPADATIPMNLTLRRATDERGTAVGLIGEAAMPDAAPMAMAMARGFGLTSAETGVVAELLRGESPVRIAANRNSSAATVRTQIKSILRKTGLHSQIDLIALALATTNPTTLAEGMGGLTDEGPRLLVQPGGRRLAWQEFGDRNGRPILFLHGMLDGWSLPEALDPHLKSHGLRLVAVARPGYGFTTPAARTTPDEAATRALETTIADLRSLCSVAGVARAALLAQGIGVIHAHAFAAEAVEYVSRIVASAGVVPDLAKDGVAQMAPRQKVLLSTLPRREEVGRMLLRLAVSLIAHRGHRRFADSLYRTSPGDLALSQDEAVFARLRAGYEMMSIQGEDGAVHDTQLLAGDWTGRLAPAHVPLDLLHGTDDPATPVAAVRSFAGSRPFTRLEEVPGCGQLVGHAVPERLCAMLAAEA